MIKRIYELFRHPQRIIDTATEFPYRPANPNHVGHDPESTAKELRFVDQRDLRSRARVSLANDKYEVLTSWNEVGIYVADDGAWRFDIVKVVAYRVFNSMNAQWLLVDTAVGVLPLKISTTNPTIVVPGDQLLIDNLTTEDTSAA